MMPYIPLSRAALCADCEVIFDLQHGACPCCGGDAFFIVTRFGNPSLAKKQTAEAAAPAVVPNGSESIESENSTTDANRPTEPVTVAGKGSA